MAASARFSRSARAHALGFETELDILLDSQPGEQGEGLEHHGDSFGRAAKGGFHAT